MMKLSIKQIACFRQLPLLLLVISCGISSGTLMTLAFLAHLVLCRYDKRPVLGPLLYSRGFHRSLLIVAVSFACLLVTVPFNDGNAYQLFKYMGRMVPLLLVAIMAKPEEDTFRTVWYGILCSLFCLLVTVMQHPVWEDQRLQGPFSSPNTLAGLLVVMVPMAMFGLVKYWKSLRYSALAAAAIIVPSLLILFCTGSRNAYGTFILVFLLLMYFVYRYRDRGILRIMGTATLIALVTVALFAPSILMQRMDRDLQKDGRVYLMQSGIQIAKEHPWMGIGAGNWGRVYKERFEAGNPNREKDIQSPHNIYLHILDETGIVGLSGFLLLMAHQLKVLYTALRRAYARNCRAFPWLIGFGLSIIAVYLFGMLDYDFFSRHMMQLYWLIWGLCLCAAESIRKGY